MCALEADRIALLLRPVLTLVSDGATLLGFVYQHALGPAVAAAIRLPCSENAHLGRLERL
jgi:hypothetical protein